MSAEQLLLQLGKSALELAPQLIEAIRSGRKQEAKDIAEEMARRQAFDALMEERAKAAKKI